MRIVTTRNQQVGRIDYETDADVDGGALDELTRQIEAIAANAHVLVLSDYRKGVVTPAVIAATVAAARARNIPLLVNPKVPNAERYTDKRTSHPTITKLS